MKNKKPNALLLLVVLLLMINIGQAYKSSDEEPTHQYLTKVARDLWINLPEEIKNYSTNAINKEMPDAFLSCKKNSTCGYQPGDDIITGSGEEDYPVTEAFQHFWDPDNPQNGLYNDGLNVCPVVVYGVTTLVDCGSNYRKAKEYWEEKVVPLYITGNIDESYYWLDSGRAIMGVHLMRLVK